MHIAPEVDLQTRAVAYFVQYHLQEPDEVPNISSGVTECISSWKNSGRSSLVVDLALSSLALAIFSRIHHYPLALAEASSKYNKLLRVARQSIGQLSVVESIKDESKMDSCLLAVTLMNWYEGAATTAFEGPSDCFNSTRRWSHHDGARAILNLWMVNSASSSPNYIVKQTRRNLIKSSLIRDLPLPAWMSEGGIFGEQGAELGYDQILVRVVALNYEASKVLKRGQWNLHAEKLCCEALALDVALQDWTRNIPAVCMPQRHTINDIRAVPTSHFYSNIINKYPKPAYASTWGHFFSIGIIVNSTRFKLLELRLNQGWTDHNYEWQRQHCIGRIGYMANNLASSVPFCLERVRVDDGQTDKPQITSRSDNDIKPYMARLMLWPLLVTLKARGMDSKQQAWFRSELQSLGDLTGDGVFACSLNVA